MSEGAGKPPVVIVNPNTTVTSGTDVQEKMIAAARVFSDLLKPTLGPRGLDKMLYKTDGNTAITNDGAKIVAELMVKHPAAKMMVSMGNSQEEACGDGVTTTMLLCGALLEEANNLLRKGLHPLTLVEGYRLGLTACIEQMDIDTQDASGDKLSAVAETALRGKGAEAALDHFSAIISQALSILSENREDASAEHVAMFKTGTGGLRDSRLIRGVVVNRRVLMDSLPNHLENAKVAVLGGDLKIRSMTRNAEIKNHQCRPTRLFCRRRKVTQRCNCRCCNLQRGWSCSMFWRSRPRHSTQTLRLRYHRCWRARRIRTQELRRGTRSKHCRLNS